MDIEGVLIIIGICFVAGFLCWYVISERNGKKVNFYRQCVAKGIQLCNSEKDMARATLIAQNLGLPTDNIIGLFKEAEKLYKDGQRKWEEEQEYQERLQAIESEKKQFDILNEYADYTGQSKKVAMLTKEYNEVSRQLQGTKDAISMTLFPELEKEHDWAVMGGMANGLAGSGAGIATAVNAQIENAQIRARNNQILHETADIRGRMVLAGAKQRDALQARCSELNAMIMATKTKLIGNDTPRQCLDALQFDDTLLSVSKTGTCMVDAKVSLKQSAYYIFDDVKATIDGTIQAEIYDGNSRIGTANLVLPLNGVPDDNMVAVKGMCLFCGQPGKHYSVKFNAENLWAMEQ